MPKRQQNIVGDQIKRLRNDQGMTQQALAESCNKCGYLISRGTLAKIEAKVRGINDIELFVISRALGCGMLNLFPSKFEARLKNQEFAWFRSKQVKLDQ